MKFWLTEAPHVNNSPLVYVGTAGVRNVGAARENKGHLRERMKWHITTRHNQSTIRNGTLSTLRTTIGSLISD